MEIFKRLNDFKDYEVSNFGRVRNIKRNSFLTPQISKRGYYCVSFGGRKIKKTKNIHRLLGIYFINNGVDGNFIVDHKDNNPLNNSLDNLQLISKRENSTKDRINATGESCVYPSLKRFRVRIKIDGVRREFGTFATVKEAVKKRDEVLDRLNKYQLV